MTKTREGWGSPAASISFLGSFTDADSMYDLSGNGVQVGVSYYLGVEYFTCVASYGKIHGVNVSLGPSPCWWPEGHTEKTYSEVFSLNWLPAAIKEIIKSTMEISVSAVSAGQIAAIDDYLN